MMGRPVPASVPSSLAIDLLQKIRNTFGLDEARLSVRNPVRLLSAPTFSTYCGSSLSPMIGTSHAVPCFSHPAAFIFVRRSSSPIPLV
jgi:hypothetical protein